MWSRLLYRLSIKWTCYAWSVAFTVQMWESSYITYNKMLGWDDTHYTHDVDNETDRERKTIYSTSRKRVNDLKSAKEGHISVICFATIHKDARRSEKYFQWILWGKSITRGECKGKEEVWWDVYPEKTPDTRLEELCICPIYQLSKTVLNNKRYKTYNRKSDWECDVSGLHK